MPTQTRAANDAWESLLTAHTQLLREFAADPVWKTHNLSMREYDVLYTLAKLNRTARLGELHAGVLLSQPALSRLVDRLVERKLIQRSADAHDGRAVQLQLTATGRELQRTVGGIHAASVARTVGQQLTATELDTLTQLTRRLSARKTTEVPSDG